MTTQSSECAAWSYFTNKGPQKGDLGRLVH